MCAELHIRRIGEPVIIKGNVHRSMWSNDEEICMCAPIADARAAHAAMGRVFDKWDAEHGVLHLPRRSG